jgi:GDPmannose 4,6-dehydratase
MKLADPIAIIVGSKGQDGRLLEEKLKELHYSVVGLGRDTLDITNPSEVDDFFSDMKPKEIYFLAAYHHSAEEYPNGENELFTKSFDIHVLAVVNILEALVNHSSHSRFFYASSCLVFDVVDGKIQTELTRYNPETPYAITKTAGTLVCQYYRNSKNLFTSVGILYNHNSPLRKPMFAAKKIVSAAARISRGQQKFLTLGNLDDKLDWGYAPDYVEAMIRILQLSKPNDYVIATGEVHSVREFTKLAFEYFGLDYLSYVTTDENLLVRESLVRIGSSERLQKDTGWKPTLSFKEMVHRLAEAENYDACNQ